RLREQHRTGAHGADGRAPLVLVSQPASRRRPSPARIAVRLEDQVGRDHDLAAPLRIEGFVGHDRRAQVAGAGAGRLGEETRTGWYRACRSTRDVLPCTGHEGEDLVQAVPASRSDERLVRLEPRVTGMRADRPAPYQRVPGAQPRTTGISA